MGAPLDNGFRYLIYATKRWGLAMGLSRWWQYHGSPAAWWDHLGFRIREYKLVDRRKKRGYSVRVYAVDRDGDLYMVECPQRHQIQRVSVHRRKDSDGKPSDPCHDCENPNTHFHCFICEIGFGVYLEDGLRELKDFREGNPPLPTKIVIALGTNDRYMGITTDAPWWWTRREVYRDFNDENGKDGHGHKPYTMWKNSPRSTAMEGMQDDMKEASK